VIDHSDVFKKIFRFEITAKKFVLELFSGMYASRFRGPGIEVEDIREFQTGDDFRAINWQRTAQMGKPYVKNFRQERDLIVFLLVDVSASCDFAGSALSKREMAAKIAALIAVSAAYNRDKVGLVLFSQDVEKIIHPARGTKHVTRILRELLSYEPIKRKTNIQTSLQTFQRLTKKKSICFIFSDFQDDNFEKSLVITAKKHDTTLVHIVDAKEEAKVPPGLIFEDLETGQRVFVSSKQEIKEYIERRQEKHKERSKAVKKTGADWLDALTSDSPVQKLITYFALRKRRLR
jgi:uncharacterized protein (DUF58 family)